MGISWINWSHKKSYWSWRKNQFYPVVWVEKHWYVDEYILKKTVGWTNFGGLFHVRAKLVGKEPSLNNEFQNYIFS